jgi:hypothetical protein
MLPRSSSLYELSRYCGAISPLNIKISTIRYPNNLLYGVMLAILIQLHLLKGRRNQGNPWVLCFISLLLCLSSSVSLIPSPSSFYYLPLPVTLHRGGPDGEASITPAAGHTILYATPRPDTNQQNRAGTKKERARASWKSISPCKVLGAAVSLQW